jgi:hypothetical protein
MTARSPLTIAGVIGTVIAVFLAITVVTGPAAWAAIFAVPTLAAIAIGRTPAMGRGCERRVKDEHAEGIVDCAGESLRIGDTVRAGNGFDGPMELTFSRGVVVKVGRGKAHVRFNDIPEQVHPVTPGTLRRLG